MTCWNGTTVIEHPNVQDCPARPKPTHTAAVRRSETTAEVPAGAYAWAHTGDAIAVANCESGDRHAPDVRTRYNGNPHLRDRKYYGKWQFLVSTWRSVGGSGNPADASEAEQDARAYALFKRDGRGQWECAGIMGAW